MAKKKTRGKVAKLMVAGMLATAFALHSAGGSAETEVSYSMSEQPPSPKDTAAVVFTGGPKRIAEGLRLYMDGKVDRLLISGVHKSLTPAKILRNAEIVQTRPLTGISLDFTSQTTQQNAEATGRWLSKVKATNIVLVTSAEHMRRSKANLLPELPPNTRLYTHAVNTPTSLWSYTRETAKVIATEIGIPGFSKPIPNI